jgi:outer membrane lipoprotein-sorting protein
MTHPDKELIDMITKATPDTPVNEDHQETLRRQVLDAYDQRETDTEPEPEHQPLYKFTGATFMKLAASIALFAAVGFFAVTALSPSKAIAFEDVAREIVNIETASFDISATITHADGTTEDEGTYNCTTRLPNLLRGQMPDGETMVIDFANDKMLVIDDGKKAALLMVGFLGFSEEDNLQKNLFGEVQEHLRNAEKGGDFGDIMYENLGEKQIDGTPAVGFRVLNPDASENDLGEDAMLFNTLDIWADAKTGGPITLEFTLDLEDGSRVTSTFNNFVYNQELDPKLFSFEAPEGYELIDGTDLIRVGQVFGGEGEIGEGIAEAEKLADEIAAELEKEFEKLGNDRPTTEDVINALRAYTQQTDGKLPDKLTMTGMLNGMMEGWKKANPRKSLFVEDATDLTFTDDQMNRNMAVMAKASTYLEVLNATGGNYTYRGKGVSVDDDPTPVLWLQSKGAPAYTVIYNDFSVREMNEGPGAAHDIEVDIEDIVKKLQEHRPTSDDVIEALRGYTEQTGGKLPDTLESGPMIDAMIEAWEKANPGKPLFKEGSETVAFNDQQLEQNYQIILNAAMYLGTLEGSGGNHTYRGKGIKVSDKPTPVLWLQSAGAPAHTVIYSDFSVRDTNQGPPAE